VGLRSCRKTPTIPVRNGLNCSRRPVRACPPVPGGRAARGV